MKHTLYILTCLLSFLFYMTSCDTKEQDYVYSITNLCDEYSPISITYVVLDDTAKTITLNYGESFDIAERLEVPGNDIWNIETSKALYKIKTVSAISKDSCHISEELAYRKFWTGPDKKESKGYYNLIISDTLLSLYKQSGYAYIVNNFISDTIIVVSTLRDQHRRADTLSANQKILIGTNDIYSYQEEYANILPKYKTQKLTGINSITIWYKENFKNINLNKDTAFFTTGKDSCYLNVTSNIFY
ncbi:MAG: hypothetical protein IJ916_07895 [Paludibacteraceae bacterium]|nr:hypothetical protein [Paludibacteraceae bacterium]MEE3483192.1 hypothetical protein [Bacteroidales bacterium]